MAPGKTTTKSDSTHPSQPPSSLCRYSDSTRSVRILVNILVISTFADLEIDVGECNICSGQLHGIDYVDWRMAFAVYYVTVEGFEGDIVAFDAFAGDNVYTTLGGDEVNYVVSAVAFHMVEAAFLYPRGFREGRPGSL